MKTLLTYVLVASMGLVTTHSFAIAQEDRVDYVASLKTLPLANDDFAAFSGDFEPIIEANSKPWLEKQQLLIYDINTAEAIDLAFGHSHLKKLVFSLWIPSSPDKTEPNSLLHQDTNFRKALMMNVRETKVTTMGEYQLSPNAKASIKLPFLKQEIGEYRHQWMFGTFAVFR